MKPVYIDHLWFDSNPASLQKIALKFPIFGYVVTADETIVSYYFRHPFLSSLFCFYSVTTGQTTVHV
jgi:hypothetical protein